MAVGGTEGLRHGHGRLQRQRRNRRNLRARGLPKGAQEACGERTSPEASAGHMPEGFLLPGVRGRGLRCGRGVGLQGRAKAAPLSRATVHPPPLGWAPPPPPATSQWEEGKKEGDGVKRGRGIRGAGA